MHWGRGGDVVGSGLQGECGGSVGMDEEGREGIGRERVRCSAVGWEDIGEMR